MPPTTYHQHRIYHIPPIYHISRTTFHIPPLTSHQPHSTYHISSPIVPPSTCHVYMVPLTQYHVRRSTYTFHHHHIPRVYGTIDPVPRMYGIPPTYFTDHIPPTTFRRLHPADHIPPTNVPPMNLPYEYRQPPFTFHLPRSTYHIQPPTTFHVSHTTTYRIPPMIPPSTYRIPGT